MVKTNKQHRPREEFRVLNRTEEFEKRMILSSCVLCVFRNRRARQAGRLMFLLRGKDALQRTKERPLRRK